MNYDLERATREWEREVGEEAAKLIREGTPPFDAAIRARDTVSRRRRQATRFGAEPSADAELRAVLPTEEGTNG